MTYMLGSLLALPLIVLCSVLLAIVAKCGGRKPAEPALTPRDLQVLHESAEELVRSITTAAEESTVRFEQQRAVLEDLMSRAEKAAEFLEARLGLPDRGRQQAGDKLSEIIGLSEAGVETADIARQLNVGSGEVELLLNLRPKLDAVRS